VVKAVEEMEWRVEEERKRCQGENSAENISLTKLMPFPNCV
jgi:hypothetical protein